MKQIRFLFLSALLMHSLLSLANEDMIISKEYGNVQTSINTGDNYEEISKLAICGQLADQLAKELNDYRPINIFFEHSYIGDCTPRFFISCDSINKHESTLNVQIYARQLNIEHTLKLIDYGLTHREFLQKQQKEMVYNRTYHQDKFHSIDSVSVARILDSPPNQRISKLIALKTYRPEMDFRYGISYYFQNNSFQIFRKNLDRSVEDLITLKNVYQFKSIKTSTALVFDTDSSFYCISPIPHSKVSQRHIIHGTQGNLRLFELEYIGGDKISIFFNQHLDPEISFRIKKRNMIYLIDKDFLIQDLDELIEK